MALATAAPFAASLTIASSSPLTLTSRKISPLPPRSAVSRSIVSRTASTAPCLFESPESELPGWKTNAVAKSAQRSSFLPSASSPRGLRQASAHRKMTSGSTQRGGSTVVQAAALAPGSSGKFTLLFVEMGVGYDQHGQDITSAAVRACKNAITPNSIPAFRTGAIPGVSYTEMKLKIKLGVPEALHGELDLDKVKAVFPYGQILNIEVVNGGFICSSGVALEAMGDKNDDWYTVNAAVYVGY